MNQKQTLEKKAVNLVGHCGVDHIYLLHVQELLFSESRRFEAEVSLDGELAGKMWNDGCGGKHEFRSYDPEMGKEFTQRFKLHFSCLERPFFDYLDAGAEYLLALWSWSSFVRGAFSIGGAGVCIRHILKNPNGSIAYRHHRLLGVTDIAGVGEYCTKSKIRVWDSPPVHGFETCCLSRPDLIIS